MNEIWFWQNQGGPLMTPLARALAERGCRVTFVVRERVSAERHALGWEAEDIPGVTLELAVQEADVKRILSVASRDAVHICEGIRSLGLIVCLCDRSPMDCHETVMTLVSLGLKRPYIDAVLAETIEGAITRFLSWHVRRIHEGS